MRVAPPDLHEARQARVRQDVAALRLEGLVVTSLPNIAYLTGLFATSASLVLSGDQLHLIVDGRYVEAARARTRDLRGLNVVMVPAAGGQMESLGAVLGNRGHSRVGVEAAHLTLRQHSDLLARLPRGVELVPTNDVIEHRRAVKDSWELELLRDAGGRLSDAAKCIIPKALAGFSERDVAAAAEAELRRVGFDKPAFDTIVASGPNSAMPHHRAAERGLEKGDLVILDFGGLLHGYAVDMTRTVTLGSPTPRQRQVLEDVAAAQSAAFGMIQAGGPATGVDAAAREVLERAGYGEAFSHGTGHGLGLEVHERPRVSRHRADTPVETLQIGMVFTLEPGAYFPGWGGVRIEDDVAITATGAEWLTDAPKL
jgi:Xaa-Pro aminopeptidase